MSGIDEGGFPAVTMLNVGLGRDSIAMLVLLSEGALLVDGAVLQPHEVDAAVFADTGAEWPHTYAQKERVAELCKSMGVPFLVLEKPPAEVWQANLRGKGSRETPAWCGDERGTIAEKAARGHYHLRLPIIDEYRRFGTIAVTVSASCTANHKVGPLRRVLNDLAVERFGVNSRRWAHLVRKGLRPKHRVLLGIAADEAERAIDTGRPLYERPIYPLVEMGVTKADETAILVRAGLGDVKKSGCVMCPYQPVGWFWVLRETDPGRWAEVLAYEAEALAKTPTLGGICGGTPVEVAVERWRGKNPDATMAGVIDKQYGRGGKRAAELACQVSPFEDGWEGRMGAA